MGSRIGLSICCAPLLLALAGCETAAALLDRVSGSGGAGPAPAEDAAPAPSDQTAADQTAAARGAAEGWSRTGFYLGP